MKNVIHLTECDGFLFFVAYQPGQSFPLYMLNTAIDDHDIWNITVEELQEFKPKIDVTIHLTEGVFENTIDKNLNVDFYRKAGDCVGIVKNIKLPAGAYKFVAFGFRPPDKQNMNEFSFTFNGKTYRNTNEPIDFKIGILEVGDKYGGGIIGGLTMPGEPNYDPQQVHGFIIDENDDYGLTQSLISFNRLLPIHKNGYSNWRLPAADECNAMCQLQNAGVALHLLPGPYTIHTSEFVREQGVANTFRFDDCREHTAQLDAVNNIRLVRSF